MYTLGLDLNLFLYFRHREDKKTNEREYEIGKISFHYISIFNFLIHK